LVASGSANSRSVMLAYSTAGSPFWKSARPQPRISNASPVNTAPGAMNDRLSSV
jgi:hypothetical protein